MLPRATVKVKGIPWYDCVCWHEESKDWFLHLAWGCAMRRRFISSFRPCTFSSVTFWQDIRLHRFELYRGLPLVHYAFQNPCHSIVADGRFFWGIYSTSCDSKGGCVWPSGALCLRRTSWFAFDNRWCPLGIVLCESTCSWWYIWD